MTISSALNAAVTGLIGNATRMGVISDNIANSSTFGYKAAGIMFNSVVIGQTGSRYTAGGVTTQEFRNLTQQGALVGSNNWGDIAVSGPGFLPVRPYVSEYQIGTSQQTLFTTTGSFSLNRDGYMTADNGLALLGWKTGTDGTYDGISRSSFSDLEPIQINTSQTIAVPSKTVSIVANLPSELGANDTPPFLMTMEYYDPLGAARPLTAEFMPAGADNTWELTLKDENDNEIGQYTLEFGNAEPENGKLISVTPNGAYGAYDPVSGSMPITTPQGEIQFKIGKLGDENGLTQFASPFSPVSVTKDGAPAARLNRFEINPAGELVGYYENGEMRTLYKIPLANMPNPDGLKALDNQTYATTNESGTVFFWDSGTSGVGTILSGALEQSTTDVATELTNMIQTQRAYSSNAKVIQTVDDMLQETTNIKR